MNDYLLIYLWAISGGVKGALVGFMVISAFAFIVFGISTCTSADNHYACKDGSFKISLLCTVAAILNLFIFIVLNVLVPSKQDLALIWAIPQVKKEMEQAVSNKDVRDISKNILDITNLKLKNFKKELQAESEEMSD